MIIAPLALTTVLALTIAVRLSSLGRSDAHPVAIPTLVLASFAPRWLRHSLFALLLSGAAGFLYINTPAATEKLILTFLSFAAAGTTATGLAVNARILHRIRTMQKTGIHRGAPT